MLLSRSIRTCESGNARTFSQKVIASIVYDSCCGMCDVAFRTAPPIGGPSCFILLPIYRTLKSYRIVISSAFFDHFRPEITQFTHLLERIGRKLKFSVSCPSKHKIVRNIPPFYSPDTFSKCQVETADRHSWLVATRPVANSNCWRHHTWRTVITTHLCVKRNPVIINRLYLTMKWNIMLF